MATVLHVQASPRGYQSYSSRLAAAFLARLTQVNPDMHVDTLDLFDANLPEFAAPAAKAKYAVMAGETPTDDAGLAWKKVIAEVARLKAADRVVISSPMWNFSIPYQLKHWIDVITQPGLTFSFSPDTGYTGLITGRPAALLLARGGAYAPGTPTQALDMQLPYLETVLQFIGFEDIHPIFVQPTLHGGPDTAAAKLAEAIDQAEQLAEAF